MNYNYVIRLVRMVVVLVVQVLLINHIHILGYATPLFIGYMLMPFDRGAGRIELLLWGFVTGLIFDSFSNTAGMAAAGMTLLAMVQPSLLEMFTPNDAAENFTPSIKTIGFWKYLLYTILCSSILNVVFYALDAFTIANWQLTLSAMGIGTAIGTVLSLSAELITHKKN